jgi:hypothetical protein
MLGLIEHEARPYLMSALARSVSASARTTLKTPVWERPVRSWPVMGHIPAPN